MKAILTVEDLRVAWPGGQAVLDGVSLSLAAGRLTGIIGPSGGGKSTLCLAAAGIIPRLLPAEVQGRILLDGQNLADLTLPEIAARVGIVFQDPETQLFLPRVLNELAFGPENLALPVPEIWERIGRVARDTGCEELLDANPNELSGGQQQIVALAAVLAMQPRVLILDEVTAQLDPESCRRIQDIIAALLDRGTAVLMVEHNLDQLALAHELYCLRNGRLEAVPGQVDAAWLARVYGESP
ncbi:MAG: ABC transporter ATP-binding protein [Firmicutes bacterium]|nr:ABC transporter ATP-binding protein [Bacillota bacterium]HOB34977.1 ABC transporter ATP-binding protein [Bacillota bacterium]HPZ90989.1 ABC transporter ATP-binding protein [Bacillota bacterium]HQE02152.1 ABC transporter ATP-binding protein [Bacillota bacterium]